MKKILAIGIGIIALSLLTCSIGLVTLEDQSEEYTVNAQLSPAKGEYLFSMDTDTELEDDLNKGIISERLKNEFINQGFSPSEIVGIKKVNDCEWWIGTKEGRIYDVKKEGGELIISTPERPSVQQESVSTKTLLTVPIGGIHENLIRLKPGGTGETYYTFYTRNGGPGEVSYKIYRVAHVGKKEEMAMPEGLKVSIEPSKFMAQPHKNYTSKITVKTSPELFTPEVDVSTNCVVIYRGRQGAQCVYKTPCINGGRIYTLYLQVIFEGEDETIGEDWLRVLVDPEVAIKAIGTNKTCRTIVSPPNIRWLAYR